MNKIHTARAIKFALYVLKYVYYLYFKIIEIENIEIKRDPP